MHTRHIDLKRIAGALFSAALLSLGLSLLFGQEPAKAQAGADALQFFKNYFITGDYVVGGVGLEGAGVDGLATGSIQMTGAPEDMAGHPTVDVLAAFLYWQVVVKDSAGPDAGSLGATFNGIPLSSLGGPFAKPLGLGTPPCWSSGGSTGGGGGAWLTFTYRADVARFLDIDPETGKYRVNGAYEVQLPDDNQRTALGASLVVIYRDPTEPLKGIVLYDGSYTLNNEVDSMFLDLKWFYDGGTSGKLTHIVGSGQLNKSEILYFNDAPVAVNPFYSSLGEHWDNPTFSFDSVPDHSSHVTTSVDHAGFSSFDCLTWAAVIYETTVYDLDEDGLLDVWEEPSIHHPTYPPADPYGGSLPDLSAMGAKVDHKDAFVEFGYMFTTPEDVAGGLNYGGVVKPAHSHLPNPQAIKIWGDAFKNAPVSNADGIDGVTLHVDAGDSYADPGDASEYLVPSYLARGGEWVNESITQCVRGDTDPVWVCQFSLYPGTVGWKTGFRFFRDQLVNTPPPLNPDGSDPCDVPGYNDGPGGECERRFDHNRRDIFRYGFFAHAVGIPESLYACLDVTDPEHPVETDDIDGQCPAPLIENPAFQTPRSITGIGDFPGADWLETLGSFTDHAGLPVGTDNMVAQTAMHEFGHTAELRHGGSQGAPNCIPTYLSVMNYLYQLRGLLDDDGYPHADYSRADGAAIDEANLLDGLPFPQLYRIGWYAPLATSYLAGHGTAAGRHCSGSPLLPTDVPMVRIDARTADSDTDWNANNVVDGFWYAQDVNFNGRTVPPVTDPPSLELPSGFNDWANIRLNQIGSRRNVGAPFIDQLGNNSFGPLSVGVGRGEWGRGEWGRGEWGRGEWGAGDANLGDLGQGDTGRGEWGRGEWGRGEWGRGEWGAGGDDGRGDYGGGDYFDNDPFNQSGELDAKTAGLLAKAPPTGFSVCVFGVDCPSDGPLHQVLTTFGPPNEGGVQQYIVIRVPGPELVPDTPSTPWVEVGRVDAVPGEESYSIIDDDQLVDGAQYTYGAIAVYEDVQSDFSNLRTITAVNDPLVAGSESYTTAEDTPLTVAAPGVLDNDGDDDSPLTSLTAVLVSGPSHGTLTLNADGSFTYTPAPNYYGADSFTYKARAEYASGPTLETDPVTVSLEISAVNDLPVAADDTYFMTWPSLTVAAPGVLTNDTDVESPLTASLVNGPSTGTLVFNADGSFTYTPGANTTGPVSFTYRAYDGSEYSNVATVRITAYFLVGEQNVPPARVSAVKSGSTQPMKWGFENETGRVDSSHVGHTVIVKSSNGTTYTFTNTDSGSSSFRYDELTQTHYFNLQTKDRFGVPFPPGTYVITITPDTPGFLPSPAFELTVRK